MVNAPVLMPDATFVVLSHLNDELGVPCVARVPNPRPDIFVRVQRVGGTLRNVVTDSASLTVESWAETDSDAADLAQEVRSIIHAMPGLTVEGVPIYKVDEFSGPASTPDPLSDTPRYSQTFSVALRGVAVTGS